MMIEYKDIIPISLEADDNEVLKSSLNQSQG